MNLSEWLQKQIDDCTNQINFMIQYAQLKLAQEDYHGVADAAMDIRDLEARKQALKDVLDVTSKSNP